MYLDVFEFVDKYEYRQTRVAYFLTKGTTTTTTKGQKHFWVRHIVDETPPYTCISVYQGRGS
jgi:hypothetical protein